MSIGKVKMDHLWRLGVWIPILVMFGMVSNDETGIGEIDGA